MEQKFLTDEALKQIDAKEFKRKIGITKTDYRFIRNLALHGIHLEGMSIYSNSERELLTLHQFIKELRDIDVLYITRLQKERFTT